MRSNLYQIKRIVTMVLVISLLFVCPVFAEDHDLGKEAEYVALSFMQNSTGEDCSVRAITRMHDLNGIITAYCVSIDKKDAPSGYVLISLLADDPIVEFSFSGIGLIDSIINVYGKNYTIESEEQFLYLGPDNIYIKDQAGKRALDIYSGDIYDLSDIESMFGDQMLLNDDGYTNGGGIMAYASAGVLASSVYKISSFGSSYDYWKMSELDATGGNTCAPTCATNIVWYWAKKRGCLWVQPFTNSTDIQNAKDVYYALHTTMATVNSSGTWDYMVPDGYAEYFETFCGGTHYSISNVTTNNYSSFVSAISLNYPVHTMLRPSSAITAPGHDVMTYGYAQSNTGANYLLVMDGWNKDSRVLQFSYYTSGTRLIKGIKVQVW